MYSPHVRGLRRYARIGPLIVAASALASCDAGSISTTSPSLLGPPGHRFAISFPGRAHERTYSGSPKRIPQYGVGILSDHLYVSGNGNAPEVRVSVESLTNDVPERRLRPFLRSYLPTTQGGRIEQWRGHTAAVGFLAPSCWPDGPCTAEQGSLVLIVGTTLFDVSTEQTSLSSAEASLNSFRLVTDHDIAPSS